MKRYAVLLVVLLLSLGVVACGTPTPSPTPMPEEPEAVMVDEEELDPVIAKLRDAGAEVTVGEVASLPFLSENARILDVNGDEVYAFVYESANAAQTEMELIGDESWSEGADTIQWLGTPHVFVDENVLLLYMDNNFEIVQLMADAYDIQANLGAGMDGEDMDVASFINRLEEAGATAAEGDAVSQPFLSVTGQIYEISGEGFQDEAIQVYPYESAADARAAMELIGDEGMQEGTDAVTWAGTPHVFQPSNLLVLYMGNDYDTVQFLAEELNIPVFGGQ